MVQSLSACFLIKQMLKYCFDITKYDGTKYIALFHSDGKHDRILDRIRIELELVIMLKGNISEILS